MPSPFDAYNLRRALEEIGKLDADWLKTNRAFYEGDHWQGGKGWIGPQPEENAINRSTVMAEIKRGFVSQNMIGEIVNRHEAAVIGREPVWYLTVRRPLADGETPNEQEQALIDEAEALLVEWWDERRIHEDLQKVTATMLWGGRGVLRLFVPPAQVDDTGQVPRADLRTSINRIYLDRPDIAQATVITDRNSQAKAGLYAYREDNKDFAEITYLDDDGNTVIRILGAGQDGEIVSETTLPLGGYLTIYEAARDVLITPQIRQNQALLNLALTMMQRNVVLGGFLERVLLNAQLPGRWEDDPERPGQKKFVPEPLKVGAGTTNVLVGVRYTDAMGNEHIANPSVAYRDPVPVTTFENTIGRAYRNGLQEAQQLHALISGDAVASGESRIQARADFATSLLRTKTQVDAAIRWLCETVLALVSVFAGTPGRYASLRVNSDIQLDPGPLSPDERRLIIERYSQGLLSRETTMVLLGVADPDAEIARIEAEREREITPRQIPDEEGDDGEERSDAGPGPS